MKKIIFYIGILLGCFSVISKLWSSVLILLYSGCKASKFRSFGEKSKIKPYLRMLVGGKYIEIGSNCLIGNNVQLTAYDCYGNQRFNPIIQIGNNSVIGDGSHLTCINRIIVGNNVLTGRNILITDNSHGRFEAEELTFPPLKRPLFSSGEVVICDNVWIGEKASIMPNVTIGEGSIIAANSVVTKDVPPYSLVAGCPAQIKKIIRK